jgi:hypothetical protein
MPLSTRALIWLVGEYAKKAEAVAAGSDCLPIVKLGDPSVDEVEAALQTDPYNEFTMRCCGYLCVAISDRAKAGHEGNDHKHYRRPIPDEEIVPVVEE